jgi:[ribosomal protein S5]-alanine N-acetyltransferase
MIGINMENPYAIGSQIYLRAPTIEDAEGNWYKWFSDPEVTKYLCDRYLPNSKEAQIEFFKSLSISKDKVVLSICRIDNNEHIGVCGLSLINWFHRNADISYVIGEKKSQNSIIITEVMKLLLNVSFNRLNLENLRSTYAGSNLVTPMIDKMYGFKVIGKLEKYIIVQGERDDLIMSQLSKEDWQSRNNNVS